MYCIECGSDVVRVMFEVNGFLYYFYFCENCGETSPVHKIEEN